MASSEAHRRGNAAAARASSVPWNDPNVDPPEDSADCPAPSCSIVSPRTRFAGRSDRSGGSSSVAEARRAAATAPPATARATRSNVLGAAEEPSRSKAALGVPGSPWWFLASASGWVLAEISNPKSANAGAAHRRASLAEISLASSAPAPADSGALPFAAA